MKTGIAVAVIAAVSGLNVMAGAAELNAVRAGDIPGMAVVEAAVIPEVAVAETGDRTARMSSKIVATPVTANWKDAMQVKFVKGTGLDEVRYVLDRAGLTLEKFSDNGDGYLVRVEIKDVDVPLRAHRLAGFPEVESVQVNRAVYARMAAGLA